jgi:hypothetical protein
VSLVNALIHLDAKLAGKLIPEEVIAIAKQLCLFDGGGLSPAKFAQLCVHVCSQWGYTATFHETCAASLLTPGMLLYVSSVELMNAQGCDQFELPVQDSHVVMLEKVRRNGTLVVINPDRKLNPHTGEFIEDTWGRMLIPKSSIEQAWKTVRHDNTTTRHCAIGIIARPAKSLDDAASMLHLDRCLLEHVSSWLGIVDFYCLLRVCHIVNSPLRGLAAQRLGSTLFDWKMMMKVVHGPSAVLVRRFTCFIEFSLMRHSFRRFFLPGLEWLEVCEPIRTLPVEKAYDGCFTDSMMQFPNLRIARLNVDGVNWGRLPDRLEEIHLESMSRIRLPQFPAGLLRLDLTGCFPVELPPLPPGLTHLAIGKMPSQGLPRLPCSLTHLDILSAAFDAALNLPPRLVHLYLDRNFNQKFSPGSFSGELRNLHLGKNYNHSLEGVLPEGLIHLHVGSGFQHPFLKGHLPSSLTSLCMADNYGFFLSLCAPRNMKNVFVRSCNGNPFLPGMLDFPALHLFVPLGMCDYLNVYHNEYAYGAWWRSSTLQFLSRNGHLMHDDPNYIPRGMSCCSIVHEHQDIDLAFSQFARDPILDRLYRLREEHKL